jgi:predicted nucleic acid-binding protein
VGRRQAGHPDPTAKDPRQADLTDSPRGPPLILYLDTSALLKLYVEEDGSTLVRDGVGRASHLATSAIAYVEVHSALGRRRRGGDLSPADFRRSTREFEEGWERYVRVDVADPLVREAARLAVEHLLRAYDAIHLASALAVRVGGGTMFASWDDDLDSAAAGEGFPLIRPHRRRP